jgi:pimeloyl-ACP methyl ester carboxylesterase
VPTIELSAGEIEYDDDGRGPVVLLLHGVLMNATVYRHVVPDLKRDHRVVVPTLPLGGHRIPMRADADLSAPGIAGLIAELMERLDLSDVTLVGNDWGGAQIVVTAGPAARVGRLVLAAVEAFENYPPGRPGRMLLRLAKTPGGLGAVALPLRLRALRHSRLVTGVLAASPVPPEIADSWLLPFVRDPRIRRDLRRFGAATDRSLMVEVGERLRRFDRPVLVLWAADDVMMPAEHGPRLADSFPDGRLVVIEDSRTAIPEDQPQRFAAEIRRFVAV